jgi:hypothetical protein
VTDTHCPLVTVGDKRSLQRQVKNLLQRIIFICHVITTATSSPIWRVIKRFKEVFTRLQHFYITEEEFEDTQDPEGNQNP